MIAQGSCWCRSMYVCKPHSNKARLQTNLHFQQRPCYSVAWNTRTLSSSSTGKNLLSAEVHWRSQQRKRSLDQINKALTLRFPVCICFNWRLKATNNLMSSPTTSASASIDLSFQPKANIFSKHSVENFLQRVQWIDKRNLPSYQYEQREGTNTSFASKHGCTGLFILKASSTIQDMDLLVDRYLKDNKWYSTLKL